MNRLLIPLGYTAFSTLPEGDRGVPYTLTAFDPAHRLYIGLGCDLGDKTVNEGLKSSTQYQVYGCTENREFCPAMATEAPWTPPLVVNSAGVCGYGRFYGSAMLTGEAEMGEAFLLTSFRSDNSDLTKEDFAGSRRLREERTLIPVTVTRVGGGYFTVRLPDGVTVVNGMSGTPVLQHNRLVGAIRGRTTDGAACVDIRQMYQFLVGIKGQALTQSVPKRARIQLARIAYALRENVLPKEADRSLRRQFQALEREHQRVADLETAVGRYERDGTPIPWRGRRVSYQEAQETLWDYWVRQAVLALHSQEVYDSGVCHHPVDLPM